MAHFSMAGPDSADKQINWARMICLSAESQGVEGREPRAPSQAMEMTASCCSPHTNPPAMSPGTGRENR